MALGGRNCRVRRRCGCQQERDRCGGQEAPPGRPTRAAGYCRPSGLPRSAKQYGRHHQQDAAEAGQGCGGQPKPGKGRTPDENCRQCQPHISTPAGCFIARIRFQGGLPVAGIKAGGLHSPVAPQSFNRAPAVGQFPQVWLPRPDSALLYPAPATPCGALPRPRDFGTLPRGGVATDGRLYIPVPGTGPCPGCPVTHNSTAPSASSPHIPCVSYGHQR
jgi:hypothetical protein